MSKVLIADDSYIDRRILADILDGYEILQADNGSAALEMAYQSADQLSLVILDVLMPGINGYEVLQRLKQSRSTQRIPVILITILDAPINENLGLRYGAIDYITKPFSADIVRARVRNQIELKRYQDNLQELVNIKAEKLLHMQDTLFDAVTSIVEYRSLESGLHVKRMRLYAAAQLDAILAKRILNDQIDKSNANIIARASTLHDIGKVSIPDRILLKPGKLSNEEYELMKTHVVIGDRFVCSLQDSQEEDFIFYARQICRHHHERWDGTGYPDRLRGEQIPAAARVVAIADVYDALVSRRVYKPAFSHEEAMRIMRESANTQFDPELIDLFTEIADTFRAIAEEYTDSPA